jgi:hypothetical protein
MLIPKNVENIFPRVGSIIAAEENKRKGNVVNKGTAA